MRPSDLHNFAYNPTTVKITRSRFDRSHRHLTTMYAGNLIPVFSDEVLPGDTFSLDTSAVVRMSTPIYPVMDSAFIDMYFFFIPNRLVWTHWKEFMGEATDGFLPDTEYTIPTLGISSTMNGSIYDHFGLPVVGEGGDSIPGIDFNALPIRGYGLVWNEWFRDQNVSPEIYVNRSDNYQNVTGQIYGYSGVENYNHDVEWFDVPIDMVTQWQNYGIPLPVAKIPDLFTTALPLPQRGPSVTLPILSDDSSPVEGSVPVRTLSTEYSVGSSEPLRMRDVAASGNSFTGTLGVYAGNGTNRVAADTGGQFQESRYLAPSNLYVEASAISINEFRQLYAMQRLFERNARSGSRYVEYIQAAFGVVSPDARQQRPEFLGGKRIPINITQVPQTSASSEESPQGNVSAFSLTIDRDNSFTYSSTEHGYILGVACVRTQHTYQQGLEKTWTRQRRFDFYDPVFANIGEQPIYGHELVNDGLLVAGEDPIVFGYQEAFYEYRYKPSMITGAFRSQHPQSLDVWHYGDYFEEQPTLSPEFIYETRKNIQRTLAVQNEPQFLCDFYFKNICTRPMPLYSVPGLSGHY